MKQAHVCAQASRSTRARFFEDGDEYSGQMQRAKFAPGVYRIEHIEEAEIFSTIDNGSSPVRL